MKRTDNKTKILFVGLVIAFFLIFQKMKSKTTIVNNVVSTPAPVELYTAKYFTDNEYFASMPKPAEYYGNWIQLVKILDKIRTAFGSAVLISKGYIQPCDCGEPLDEYMMCRAVNIVPQNKDYNFLYQQALTLKVGGYINLKTLQQNENKSITIII